MDFSSVLAAAIAARGVSQNAAGPLLGVAGPFINQIIKRKRRPPMDRIEKWADILGMVGDSRRQFIDLAAIEHIPADARERFLAIYAAFQSMESRVQVMQKRIETLESQGKRHG